MPFVHPTAVVDAGAIVGEGTSIWHFVHVSSSAEIGRNVVLGQNVYVGDGVIVGDDCRIQNNVSLYSGVKLGAGVFVGPSAVFTNVLRPRAMFPRKDQFAETYVGDGATIGANATLVCGHSIGVCALVGAGTVVTKDVPAFAVFRGNPGHICGFVCRCGESLALKDQTGSCESCRRCYRLVANTVIEVES